MLRAKKGQQTVPILKKTAGLCPSRSYYSLIRTLSQSSGQSDDIKHPTVQYF